MDEQAAAGRYDVVVVGGGHNGLTAAAYCARAGLSVLVLERAAGVGGAAVSAEVFPGTGARLSRYSYLVSLLPARVVRELGLDVRLVRRRWSSWTPDPDDPARGLLVDGGDAAATRASLLAVGGTADADGWEAFSRSTATLARGLWPTLVEPLRTRAEARALVGDDAVWDALVEQPLGAALAAAVPGDLARGVLATDGLIGVSRPLDDETLEVNRCFLLHVVGGGTGHWDVPVGGMGAVSGALERSARSADARLVTGAEVTAVSPDGEVTAVVGGEEVTATARWVLSGVAPAVLEVLLAAGGADAPADPVVRPEGAQVKTNLLVRRLPRLLDAGVAPGAAFGGTFHVHETASRLDAAFAEAAGGRLPSPQPCEVYCHTLADRSILPPDLDAGGAHTMTVFGLHVPDALVPADGPAHDAVRDRLQDNVLRSLGSVLAEPVDDLLLRDADGRPCVETRTTKDLERSLGLPGGHIFHGPLAWPFVEDGDPLGTPAERWGVATRHPRVLLAGSGARRGGGVSGLGGHGAAMAVLEAEGLPRP